MRECPKCGENDQAQFYATSNHCRECHRKWMRDHRLKQLGTDAESQARMFDMQRGRCSICGQDERLFKRQSREMGGLHQDHCHLTGKLRALLCSRCNQVLGRVQESAGLLRAMADYLDRWR